MSRSKRHSKIFGNTTAKSEKRDKQLANRRLRRRVADAIRESVQSGDEGTFPIIDEVGNKWLWEKDGKTYWPEAGIEDMRK